jgi:hypothetical protein
MIVYSECTMSVNKFSEFEMKFCSNKSFSQPFAEFSERGYSHDKDDQSLEDCVIIDTARNLKFNGRRQ